MTAVMVYRKGSAWMRQFEYSFGKDKVDELLRRYQGVWRFRHPYPPDFEKLASETFGQRMDEVFDTFLRGTELPDYTLQSLRSEPTSDGKFKNTLQLTKRERAHVPLRLFATDASGSLQVISIPSDMLNAPNRDTTRLAPWFWAAGDYTAEFITQRPITTVRLDTAGNLLREDLMKNHISTNGSVLRNFGFMTRFDEAMPLDEYGISIRPSVWWNPIGGFQLGVRADGVGTYQSPKFTFGLYYNFKERDNYPYLPIDFQFAIRQNWNGSNTLNTGEARVFSLDGVFGVSLRSFEDVHSTVRYAREDINLSSIMLDALFFIDPTYYGDYNGILRAGAIFEKRWKIGYWQIEPNLIAGFISNINGGSGGITLRAEWSEILYDSPVFSIRSRAFAYVGLDSRDGANNGTTLQTGSTIDNYENIPARFSRIFSTSSRNLTNAPPQDRFIGFGLPVFTPGGGGFVRSGHSTLLILASNFFLGNKTLKTMGVQTPIIEALKPGAWISSAITERGFNFDSGISLSINLADIAPESRLLWMFKDEVSLTAYVPLVSYIPGRAWVLGYDGVRIGVSTTIGR
jgi:hypothetical protein